ncbi:DUF5721 family protein [uncultured Tyzzerella sp.]|uniref:DUF5721 family protein n=1 Tax=uncultured Tyzzerella sp. TaxID=2321398 RepID=UPI002942EAB6|nr:DUF5721 family protein [uncultured Tyzzerella sp.]
MLVFSIENDEVKIFMQKLLREEAFDKLEIRNISLETIVKYEILGNINKDYLQEDENRYFVKWKELKPYIVSIIKGNVKPKFFKIVFSLDDNIVNSVCDNANAMFLNITYQNDKITGTTGTSQKVFSLDKKEDKVWEDIILKFFKKNGININIEN